MAFDIGDYDGDDEMRQAVSIMANTDRRRRSNHPGGYWCPTSRPCPECVNPIAAYRLAASHLGRCLRPVMRALIHAQSTAQRRNDRRAAYRTH